MPPLRSTYASRRNHLEAKTSNLTSDPGSPSQSTTKRQVLGEMTTARQRFLQANRKSKSSKRPPTTFTPIAPQRTIKFYFNPIPSVPAPSLPGLVTSDGLSSSSFTTVTHTPHLDLPESSRNIIPSTPAPSLTGSVTPDSLPSSSSTTVTHTSHPALLESSRPQINEQVSDGISRYNHGALLPEGSESLDGAFIWTDINGKKIVQRYTGYSDYRGLMARTLPGITIKKQVQAPNLFTKFNGNDEDPFSFVYSHRKLYIHPERLNFEAHVLAAYTQRGNRPLWDLGVRIKGVRQTVFRVERHLFSRPEVTLILDKMMDALIRWPTLDELFGSPNRNTSLAAILFSAAKRSVLPEKPALCKGYWISKQVFLSIIAVLPFINQDTLKPDSINMTITPKTVKEDCDEVENTLFTFNSGVTWCGPDENGRFPSILKRDISEADNASIEGFDRAQRLIRLCLGTWAQKSPLSTKTKVTAWYRGMVDQHHKVSPVYDGKNLIATNAQILLTQLVPSSKVNDNTSITLPSVQIYSMDRSWVDLVRDKATSTWLQTSDLIKTWETLGIMADEINTRILSGESSPAICHCTADESSKVTHPCGGCGKRVLCHTLQLSFRGLRSCTKCILKGHPDFVTNAERNCFFKLKFLIQDGLKTIGLEKDSVRVRHLVDEAKEWARNIFVNEKGMSYVDAYSGKRLEPPPQAFHPLMPSTDAIFPFFLRDSGDIDIHCIENLAVIPACIAKGSMLPIALAKVGKYLRELESIQSANESDLWFSHKVESVETKLVNDMSEITIIQNKIPYTRQSRHLTKTNQKKFNYLKEEWVSGKLHPGSPQIGKLRFTGPAWETHTWMQSIPRLLQIVQQIEEFTGYETPRHNGCPYIAHSNTMPDNWGWQLCGQFFNLRLGLLTRWCNKYWITEESAETLFLECIFQTACRKMRIQDSDPDRDLKKYLKQKYAEFLRLPLAIQVRSANCISIAHRIHGQRMRTGWKISPMSLQDRDDELNNILIESRMSNMLKLNYHEYWYPLLKKTIMDLDIPIEIANENLVPSPFNAELEPDLSSNRKVGSRDEVVGSRDEVVVSMKDYLLVPDQEAEYMDETF